MLGLFGTGCIFFMIGVRESGLFKLIMIAGFQIVSRNLGKMRLVCPPPNKSSFKNTLNFLFALSVGNCTVSKRLNLLLPVVLNRFFNCIHWVFVHEERRYVKRKLVIFLFSLTSTLADILSLQSSHQLSVSLKILLSKNTRRCFHPNDHRLLWHLQLFESVSWVHCRVIAWGDARTFHLRARSIVGVHKQNQSEIVGEFRRVPGKMYF